MRKQRIVDKRLVREVGKRECAACGRDGVSEVHHIKSRGAGGPDLEENLLPLCHPCHEMTHKIGTIKMMSRYPFLRVALRGKGWTWEDGKLIHNEIAMLFHVD